MNYIHRLLVRNAMQDIRNGLSLYLRLHITGTMGGFSDGVRCSQVRYHKDQLQAKSVSTGKWINFESGRDCLTFTR
jgi:hypothetical protein